MSDTNKQTQTSTNTLMPSIGNAMNFGLGQATDLARQGGLAPVNTMSTVVPYSSGTMLGRDIIQRNAANNQQYDRMAPLVSALGRMADTGTNQKMNRASQTMLGFTKADGNVNSGNQTGLMRDFQGFSSGIGPSYSEQNLRGMASGKMLDPGKTPYLDQVINAAGNRTNNQSLLNAARAGRSGSTDASVATARALQDVNAGFLSNQYNQNVQNMMGANQMMDSAQATNRGLQLSGMGQALNAANSASGIQAANKDRRIGAANNLFGMGQQAFNNMAALPGIYQAAMDARDAPARTMMGLGAMDEDLYGRLLNDRLRIGGATQTQGYDNISRLLALIGNPGAGATTTSTMQGPSNMFSNILGAGLGGLSLLRGGGTYG